MAAISYNDNIPLATDQLNQSQSEIQTNFNSIKTFVEKQHVAFSNADYPGFHTKMILVAGAGTTAANQVGMYVSAADLFIDKNGKTPANITFLDEGDDGYCYLANNLKMVWGTSDLGNKTPPTAFAFSFHEAFVTEVYFVQITPINASSAVQTVITLQTKSTSGGTVTFRRTDGGTSATDAKFQYIAYGI